jgi:hypothetical protein
MAHRQARHNTIPRHQARPSTMGRRRDLHSVARPARLPGAEALDREGLDPEALEEGVVGQGVDKHTPQFNFFCAKSSITAVILLISSLNPAVSFQLLGNLHLSIVHHFDPFAFPHRLNRFRQLVLLSVVH